MIEINSNARMRDAHRAAHQARGDFVAALWRKLRHPKRVSP